MDTVIRKPYEKRERKQTVIEGATRAQQHMKDECDVNHILKKYSQTGLITHLAARPGAYQDMPGGLDFQDAVNLVMDAQENFDALPSAVRARFNNDPGAFLAFAEDPANRDEMVTMGLLNPPRPPDPEAAGAAPQVDAAPDPADT